VAVFTSVLVVVKVEQQYIKYIENGHPQMDGYFLLK